MVVVHTGDVDFLLESVYGAPSPGPSSPSLAQYFSPTLDLGQPRMDAGGLHGVGGGEAHPLTPGAVASSPSSGGEPSPSLAATLGVRGDSLALRLTFPALGQVSTPTGAAAVVVTVGGGGKWGRGKWGVRMG